MSRSSYLTPSEMYTLCVAVEPLDAAFNTTPMLVGSVLTRPDYRDIDVRMVLMNDEYDHLFATENGGRLHNLMRFTITEWLNNRANLSHPIDFDIQRMTEANIENEGKPLNALVSVNHREHEWGYNTGNRGTTEQQGESQ
jgi:hypothetical protein